MEISNAPSEFHHAIAQGYVFDDGGNKDAAVKADEVPIVDIINTNIATTLIIFLSLITQYSFRCFYDNPRN